MATHRALVLFQNGTKNINSNYNNNRSEGDRDGDLLVSRQTGSVDDVMDIVNLLLGCYLSVPLTMMGSAGNVIIILVLSRQDSKDNNTIVLFSLAVCDFYFVFLQFLRKLGCIVEKFDHDLGLEYSVTFTAYLWVSGRYAYNCSIGHVTLIGIERYVAVFYPFQVARLLSRKRLYIGMVCLYVCVLALIAPAFFLWDVGHEFDVSLNRTVAKSVFSQRGILDYYFIFITIVWTLIIIPLNGCLVLFLSVSVAVKFRSLSKQRSAITNQSSPADVRSTLMALSISFVCLMSTCSMFGIHLYIYKQPQRQDFGFMFLYNIEEFCASINSSVNVLIYMALSSKFNSGLRALCFCHPMKASKSK